MNPIINGKAKSLQVTQKATTYYNTWIQKRMESTVFFSCLSYYRGDNKAGAKNLATFPGMMSLYWWITRKPRWDDFKVVGGEQWFYQQLERKVALTNYALVGLLVCIVGYIFSML